MTKRLTPEEVSSLKKRHKTEKSRDVADRMKAVILWNSGWSEEKIAEALSSTLGYSQEASQGLL
jgi:hypothetical protein